MEWYEKTEKDYTEAVARVKKNMSKEQLEHFKDMFTSYVKLGGKNKAYWEYELKFIEECLKGE